MTAPEDPIRVVHVDDDPDFAALAATYLEREDDRITVETATCAERGLEHLAERDVDCIVSDYEMPGTNGIEFLEAVRGERPELPFIFYTGKGSEAVAGDAVSAGATDYLQKGDGTGHYTVLANRIANAVEQYRSKRETDRRRERQTRQREAITELAHAESVVEGEFDAAMREVTETATAVLGVARVNVWLFDTTDGISRCIAHYDRRTDTHDDGTELAVTEYPEYYEALETEWAIAADDVREDPRTAGLVEAYLEPHGIGALLDAPIRSEGEFVGVVCHEHVGGPREWTDDEIEFANDLADIVHRALRNRERNERERELRRTERKYQAIFNDPNILVGLIDTDGTVLDINRTAMGYIDATLGTVTGEPFWETPWFDHAETARETVKEWVERAADGEYVEFEADRVRPGGDRYTVRGVFRPVRDDDGTVVSLLISSRDVSDQKRHERQLEALNRMTQELMDVSTRTAVSELGVKTAREVLGLDVNAVHLHDEDRGGLVPVAATDDAYELIGEPPVLAEGNSIAWRVYEQGEALARDDIADDPDLHNPETPIRSELYLPLGEYGILIAASPTPETFDEQDVLLGEMLAGSLTAALSQLERTEQLRAREQELTRQNDRLEQFASVISHDLRNPLNVAQGRVELASEEYDSEHLEAVKHAHARIRALIDDLLTLAREGETVTDPEHVDLAATLEACWATVETADATLVGEIDRTVRGDEGRLKQLFENLTRNSVEHGGEDVTVAVGEIDGGFYFADDGPGIPEADRADIFEAGHSTNPNGTGFGLSIVEGIVEAHGWEIDVTDAEGGGARFEITGVGFVDGA